MVYKSRKVKLSLPRITNDDLICTTKNVSWRRSYFVPRIAVVTLERLGFSSTVGRGNGVPHYQGLHPRGRGVMTVISAFLGWSILPKTSEVSLSRVSHRACPIWHREWARSPGSDQLPDMRGIGKLGLRPGHSEDEGTGYSGLTQFGW